MTREEAVSPSTDLTDEDDLEEISKIVSVLDTDEKILLVIKQYAVKPPPRGSQLTTNIVFATDKRIIMRDPIIYDIQESIVDISYDEITTVKLIKSKSSSNIVFRCPGLINPRHLGPLETSIDDGQYATIHIIQKDKAEKLLKIIRNSLFQRAISRTIKGIEENLQFVPEKASVKEPILQIQDYISKHLNRFGKTPYILGQCNICGNYTAFFCHYNLIVNYRESLVCAVCKTTSRYRSIARGILLAMRELRGIEAHSIAEINQILEGDSLRIYDTQVPFCYDTCAYPIPYLLSKCQWIDVQTSIYQPHEPWGVKLGTNITNQNLERLTFSDNTFDIVITSEVMEHVRLDDVAHQEIRRVLKPGGVYLFTVPHFRDKYETFVRISVTDASDPSKDKFLAGKEYHGDSKSDDANRPLSYRAYGTDIDKYLWGLGFSVAYCHQDFPDIGIMNTELFFCRLSK